MDNNFNFSIAWKNNRKYVFSIIVIAIILLIISWDKIKNSNNNGDETIVTVIQEVYPVTPTPLEIVTNEVVAVQNTATPTPKSTETPIERLCSPEEIRVEITFITTIPEDGGEVNIDNVDFPQPHPGAKWILTNKSGCNFQVDNVFAQNEKQKFIPAIYYSETNARNDFLWETGKTSEMYVILNQEEINSFNGWNVEYDLFIQVGYKTVLLGDFKHNTQSSWFIVTDSPGPRWQPDPQPVFKAATVQIEGENVSIETELTKNLDGNGFLHIEKPCEESLQVTIIASESVMAERLFTGTETITLEKSEDYSNCGDLTITVGSPENTQKYYNPDVQIGTVYLRAENQTSVSIRNSQEITLTFPNDTENSFEDHWKDPFTLFEGETSFYIFK